MFTLIAAFVVVAVIVGGISLVAFDFFPGIQIQSGQGDLTEILKWEGGGILVSILLLSGGLGMMTMIFYKEIVPYFGF